MKLIKYKVDCICFLIPLTFFCIFSLTAKAQVDKCKKITRKRAIEYYDKATTLIGSNTKEAYKLLELAIRSEPEYAEAYFALGDINYQNANKKLYLEDEEQKKYYYDLSKNFFLKALEYCPKLHDYFSYYYVGKIFYYYKSYEEAESYLAIFVDNNKRDIASREETKELIINVRNYKKWIDNPVPFNPYCLQGVCTETDEFLPLIVPDGSQIYYTHRYKKKQNNSSGFKNKEEFTYSKKLSLSSSELDTFELGKAMPYPFNQGLNQGGATMTIDNRHIYIAVCKLERMGSTSYKNCDIYVSDLVDKKWSNLKRLSSKVNGNNTFEAQPSISPDGRVLYFASARKNSYGGLDIYKSIKNKSGKWTRAENLGPKINTKGNDKTPFIHPDNHSLYFASDGHFGLGGLDIFCSKRDSSNNWQKAVNIGYPINTEKDEFGFIVSTDGSKIYFSSDYIDGIGVGGYDIYSSQMPESVRPNKVLFVKGKLYDKDGHPLTDADVELQSVQTKETTEGLVDKTSGNYAVAVKVNKDEEFILLAKKNGYIYSYQYINPNTNEFETPTIVDLKVKPIETGMVVKLHNVHFATNSWQINMVSELILDNLADLLQRNPTLHIAIHGHTDNVGEPQNNMILSTKRALSVRDYLKIKNIKDSRITYKGFGETNPIARNTTKKGRAVNRRTEFVITQK